MAEKLFIDAQQLLEESLELGRKVIKDGFEPDLITVSYTHLTLPTKA